MSKANSSPSLADWQSEITVNQEEAPDGSLGDGPHITRTRWWDDVLEGVFGPRKGGARIIVDSEDASTGVGKTGCAVYIARLLSREFGYELKKEDLTLSGAEYLERWREQPGKEQPSVLVLDELSGAGAGDARRSMSTQNVNLGRSWQLMRKKRIVTLVTLPHWSDADKKMRRFADYRLWCRRKPIGYFVPYKVGTTFDNGSVNTRGYDEIERIRFPNLDDRGDEYYVDLSQKKDDLLESEYFDADELTEDGEANQPDAEEAKRNQKMEIAQRLRDSGQTTTAIAETIDMSQSWVSQHTEPRGDSDE